MNVVYEILSLIKEPFLLVDSDLKVLSSGQGVKEMGYTPDSLKGSSLESVVAPPFRRTVDAMLDTAFKLGKPTVGKVEVLNAFGERIPVEARVSAVEEKGHLKYLIVLYPQSVINYDLLKRLHIPIFVLDTRGNVRFYNEYGRTFMKEVSVSELKDGQSVRVANKEFTASVVEAVDGFRKVRIITLFSDFSPFDPRVKRFAVAGILSALASHDVKNAISSLILLIELVEDRKLREKIRGSVNRIYRIHQRILNLAKGKREVSVFNLSDLLDEIEEDLRHKLLKKNVQIIRDFPRDFTLKTDRNAVYEILLNLISNAIDVSSPNKNVIVQAGVSHGVNPKGCEKFISVRDFGPGIPHEKINKLFRLFFTSKKEGSGLGLFIVKLLTESIGGKISVWSEPGKGAKFTLILSEDGPEGCVQMHGAGSG